jgi:ABC-type nitrate/sulfonate/bicarbonate transport system permease component
MNPSPPASRTRVSWAIGVIGKLMDVGLRRMERALIPWRAQYQGN